MPNKALFFILHSLRPSRARNLKKVKLLCLNMQKKNKKKIYIYINDITLTNYFPPTLRQLSVISKVYNIRADFTRTTILSIHKTQTHSIKWYIPAFKAVAYVGWEGLRTS